MALHAILLLAGTVWLGAMLPGCVAERAPRAATLGFTGDFQGFQRPCG